MNRLYAFLVGVALIVSYAMGHSVATTEADLEMARYKLDLAESMKASLLKEKEKYALKEQTLIDSFKRDRQHYDARVRQLERKLSARADCKEIARERDGGFELAVEGERLLLEAQRIVESLR